jgi:hypothetical protein
MIRYFFNTTDNFICNRIKNVFEQTEQRFEEKQMPLDLSSELEKLEAEPLGCVLTSRDAFERSVKFKIKLIIGFFFVLVPLLVFGTVSYLTDINITFAVYATLLVAYLVSSRIETLARRYVQTRRTAFA